MQTTTTNSAGRVDFIVRPELVPSTLRLLDEETEYWHQAARECAAKRGEQSEDAVSYRKLTAVMASAADAVRAGKPFDIAAYRDAEFPRSTTGRHIVVEVRQLLTEASEDLDEPADWRYLSDLAALAADIQEATHKNPPQQG